MDFQNRVSGRQGGRAYNPDKRDYKEPQKGPKSTAEQPCHTWRRMLSLKAWEMGDKASREKASPSSELEYSQADNTHRYKMWEFWALPTQAQCPASDNDGY